jgi:hypothetical protein
MHRKVIILLGQRVRSGTNFVGSTLSQHPDVVTLPINTSLGEFNLFSDNLIIDVIYDTVARNSFGLDFSNNDKTAFLIKYGELWLELLMEKFNIPNNKIIFIKSPSVKHVKLWKAAFPQAKIAIIYRDGRDNVISSIRASNDKRTWHTFFIKLKKRLNYFSGRSFINHARQWSITANDILKIKKSDDIKTFKYENLNNSTEYITKLLQYYNLKINETIVNKCVNAPVVGSSFGIKSGGMIKPNWKPDSNKSKYIFTNKWKHWGLLKKLVFNYFAGNELIKLGYEKDNNW